MDQVYCLKYTFDERLVLQRWNNFESAMDGRIEEQLNGKRWMKGVMNR